MELKFLKFVFGMLFFTPQIFSTNKESQENKNNPQNQIDVSTEMLIMLTYGEIYELRSKQIKEENKEWDEKLKNPSYRNSKSEEEIKFDNYMKNFEIAKLEAELTAKISLLKSTTLNIQQNNENQENVL